MRRNKPPAFVGRDLRKITDPRYVGRGHGKVAIQHVGRYPQGMSAVGGRDAKLPLAASLNAALSALTLLPIVAYSIQTPRPDAPANELLTQSRLPALTLLPMSCLLNPPSAQPRAEQSPAER